jgi:hypothetical protein
LPAAPLRGVAGFQPLDQVLADEHVLRPDANLEPDHGRIAPVGELDDEVLDAADFGPGRIQHGAALQLRDHDAPLVRPMFCMHAAVVTFVAHRSPISTKLN